jgi:CRP-like cAMP-binding protein
MERKLAMLRGVPLFVGLDERELRDVGALCDEVDMPAGHELIREGTSGAEFFLILEGDVRVHRFGQTLRVLGPGDFLGEIALIDHSRRTASATCETPTRLLVLAHREFHSLLDAQPDIRVHVLEALARRLRELQPDSHI